MLQRLVISNYALIDRLELEPCAALSIITGETGAGKSIMLGALSLLLGERADSRVITDKERKSTVEAVFADVDEETRALVKEIDPDWDGTELTAFREISPTGRSRAYINETPVKLTQMAEVTRRLVDIHSQNSNILLSDPERQLQLIDALAGNGPLLEEYRAEFRRYVGIRTRIKRIREEIESNLNNRRIYEMQLEQLDALDPKPGELTEVERRFDFLSDLDDIRSRMSRADYELSGKEESAVASVMAAAAALSGVDLANLEGEADLPLDTRLRSLIVELKDIAETVSSLTASIEMSQGELDSVTSRMNELLQAQRHFRTDGPDGLVNLRADLRSRIAMLDGGDEEIPLLEEEARASAAALKEIAFRLSDARKAAAAAFEVRLTEVAIPLGLPNLKFLVTFTAGKLNRDGADRVEFLCSFNKNGEPAPLGAVASGGEMSRIMLAIKSIVAGKMKQPTVIFDEIDTGVSGDIADRMGAMMAGLGESMQVMAITHLPQVASKGERHFKVYKHDTDSRTVSEVRQLNHEQRVREIAGMISGREINEAALEAARQLMK